MVFSILKELKKNTTMAAYIHVTLLDIFISVLVHTVLLPALTVHPEESANRHPGLVVLVKEPTGLTLHTQAPKPVPANRLPEAPPPILVGAGARLVRRDSRALPSGVYGGSGGRCPGGRVGLDEGSGGGARVWGPRSVETPLEVEAETSLRVLHCREKK